MTGNDSYCSLAVLGVAPVNAATVRRDVKGARQTSQFPGSPIGSRNRRSVSRRVVLALRVSAPLLDTEHLNVLALAVTNPQVLAQAENAGTPLYFLKDRAFCNFPLLESLNLQRCSLRAMYGSPFICLTRLRRLKLKNNELTTIKNETFQGLVSLTSLKLTKNKIVFYDATPVFAPLVNLDVLHLGENMIEVLFPELFVSLPVSKLTLAINYISEWSAPIFSSMTNLSNLRLDGNKLRALDESMYNDIANLTNVRICYNPWDCTDCNIKYVALFLLEAANNHCCVDCVVCSAKGSLSNVLVMDAAPGTEQACLPPDYYVIVGVPSIMLLLVGSVTGYAVYTNRWYIRYFLLFLRVKVKAYRRLRSGDRFLWDAFVSYHSSDADWVREHIVPTLESTVDRFRLCVAERDFIPGLPIAENVCRGISQSRKSLFVLSRQFAESRWCMFELTLAQHRLFESDRENQMVFIRREQMDESALCPLLSYLFRTKTYVQAPPEDADENVRDYFWLQVRAALELLRKIVKLLWATVNDDKKPDDKVYLKYDRLAINQEVYAWDEKKNQRWSKPIPVIPILTQ
ncbi:hypothetical protein V5799_003391 [Amblyomma americanum]|uniref:TIR domain-containing protein n=1 Tax=Amblyomma americanum TaxID=6943 RepID=A0AAQ4D937_AMBAM